MSPSGPTSVYQFEIGPAVSVFDSTLNGPTNGKVRIDPIPAGNTVTGNFSPQVVPGAAREVWVTTSSDGTAYVYGTWAYTEPNP